MFRQLVVVHKKNETAGAAGTKGSCSDVQAPSCRECSRFKSKNGDVCVYLKKWDTKDGTPVKDVSKCYEQSKANANCEQFIDKDKRFECYEQDTDCSCIDMIS
jgi:hypothetical protein